MENVTRYTLEDAIACVKQYIAPMDETERISLLDASGRILSEMVAAPHGQPPFPRSPLDGYAFRAMDSAGSGKETPVKLQVIDEVMAGAVSCKTVGKGEAIRIMTGAPIPEGADCVIRQEDTDYGEETVSIYAALKPYENYCHAGEDYHKGDILLMDKTKLTSTEIGLIASLGYDTVQVYKQPRIHVMTTGDELMMPGQTLLPGKIYDSNLYSIGMRLKELGFEAYLHQHVFDDSEAVAEAIRKIQVTADVIITTGGVSVGKKDIMHDVLKILGAEKIFWKMDVKPGTPTLCGCYNGTLIIGLSGNPFGAVTNLEVFVRPILSYLSQDRGLMPYRHQAVMQQPFAKSSKVRRFVRAIYHDGHVSLPQGSHASGILSSMCGCNCLIDIPSGSGPLDVGDTVWVQML